MAEVNALTGTVLALVKVCFGDAVITDSTVGTQLALPTNTRAARSKVAGVGDVQVGALCTVHLGWGRGTHTVDALGLQKTLICGREDGVASTRRITKVGNGERVSVIAGRSRGEQGVAALATEAHSWRSARCGRRAHDTGTRILSHTHTVDALVIVGREDAVIAGRAVEVGKGLEANTAFALCNRTRILVRVSAASSVGLAWEGGALTVWAEYVHSALRGRSGDSGADSAETHIVPSVCISVIAGKVVWCRRIAADSLETCSCDIALIKRPAGHVGTKIDASAHAVRANVARGRGIFIITRSAICSIWVCALAQDAGAWHVALI